MPIVNADRVLPFPRLRPAKATLDDDTRDGVRHLIAMAPILGATNPEGVPVVEHVMQNLIDAPPPDDGSGVEPSAPTVARQVSPLEADRRRQIQAHYQALVMDQVLDQWIERQRARSEQSIRMLKDQAGDLSAAS
jgi:hypothetical protein